MKKTTKIVVAVAVLGAAGVAGYFGYKKYKESQAVTGLGFFADGGYADYNAHVASRYWNRMNQMNAERLSLQALRGY